MMRLLRTDSGNADFLELVRSLDADLSVRDGAEHAFYSQFNKVDRMRYVVVAYDGILPIACGAIKEFSENVMEIKRMFVAPESRQKGIATKILCELEGWARELGYKKCVLETGKKQPEAIALYRKNGYNRIANYGQYEGIENSLCFEKKLT